MVRSLELRLKFIPSLTDLTCNIIPAPNFLHHYPPLQNDIRFFVFGCGCQKQETLRQTNGVCGDIAEDNLQTSDVQ